MNLFLRLIWNFMAARFRPACSMMGPCVTPLRVWPSDLDILGHMNNGVYFSIMDIGRVDMMLRSGLWRKLKEHGLYPVIAAETMRFRRSLQLFDRFAVKTRVIGWDDKSFLLEQVFIRGQEIVAEGIVRARFLRKKGGTVHPDVILGFANWRGPSPQIENWIAAWNSAQSLSKESLQSTQNA